MKCKVRQTQIQKHRRIKRQEANKEGKIIFYRLFYILLLFKLYSTTAEYRLWPLFNFQFMLIYE
jgi:hypothetical protein